MSNVAIGEHALLSDCGAAALVTSAGSVDWLCLPRYDSPAVFGRLLDDAAGHFLIAPADGGFAVTRRYRTPSLVLETIWSGPAGELVVTDALALGRRERGHDLGLSAPGVLIRRVRCTRGTVAVRVEFVPRPEFGLVHPRLSAGAGTVLAHGGATVLVLSTPVGLELDAARACTTARLSAGQSWDFALQQADAWGVLPKRRSPRRIRRLLRGTEESWRSWSALHQKYEGPLRDLVHHSGVVLRGLTYARSGALIAAPTTSLPEGIGSGRTWDYRYTWVRDASMTMQGLFIAACPDEGGRFFDFLARAAATQLDRGRDLQIMYGIGGERDLTERELGHLSGWRDCGPVRVGNGAWSQRQLDVYGSLLDAAHTLRSRLGTLDAGTRAFLVAAVDAAADRWAEDDQGIWEIRGPARPYLHSKLMCWVALDRGLDMLDLLGAGDRAEKWAAARAELRESILTDGWNAAAGAFTQYYGSADLDASALLLPIVGFLSPDDPRVRSTVDAVEAALADERGLLYRYRSGDGFDTAEGTFLLCTFWLAHALALTGQLDRSRETLLRAAGYATELGLLAKQVDPGTGELLGNFPQAFSHLGLVTAAHALAEAERALIPGATP
ncbi:glycoside hydrolase family 15 protein [Sporichthya sp.]|uniref:glycoside hydrolase family 15 protein n=1 Tax=Sporichthya sp. TaxID=65475 RepID=UPI001855E83C|nr:glycoside hydrolase family 15 protein [Sporichthya sp.]MBA3742866.1 glycoside hydrolase family 15 protein [Sporichthya sp.]